MTCHPILAIPAINISATVGANVAPTVVAIPRWTNICQALCSLLALAGNGASNSVNTPPAKAHPTSPKGTPSVAANAAAKVGII